MAYLPGERPLVCPWQNEPNFRSPYCDAPSRSFTVKRNVCGNGSAYVEWGNGSSITKAIAVVKGPRQQSTVRAIFDVDVSFAAFASIVPNQHDSAKEIASYIKEAFEGCVAMDKYPQCALSVFVKVIECGKSIHSTLAACMLAAVEACSSGGVETTDELICMPVGVLPTGDLLVNPPDECESCVTVGITANSREIVFIHSTGTFSKPLDQMDSLINLVDGSVDKFRELLALRRM